MYIYNIYIHTYIYRYKQNASCQGKAGGSTGSRATKAVEAAKEDASKPSKERC